MAISQIELRKAFISALRNPRLRKCTGALKKGSGPTAAYCILGVAVDTYLKNVPSKITFAVGADGALRLRSVEEGLRVGSLPEEIRRAYGFRTNDGSWTDRATGKLFIGDATVRNLVALNDATYCTLARAADLVEADPGLWVN